MRLIDVYTQLRSLGLSAIKTQDVAAYLDISITHASKLLARLVAAKQLIHVARGVWIFPDADPLILPECLTAPFPAYISLQTALYYHGIISQIPNIMYAVSIARTRLFKTPFSIVSIHHIQPDFFFGYETQEKTSIKIATPEKALIDTLYLGAVKSKLFASLPEVELKENFKIKKARDIINKISSSRKKTFVEHRFEKLLEMD